MFRPILHPKVQQGLHHSGPKLGPHHSDPWIGAFAWGYPPNHPFCIWEDFPSPLSGIQVRAMSRRSRGFQRAAAFDGHDPTRPGSSLFLQGPGDLGGTPWGATPPNVMDALEWKIRRHGFSTTAVFKKARSSTELLKLPSF